MSQNKRRPKHPSLKRKTYPKRVNPERKAREFARQYGSTARVRFIKSLPCGHCSRQPEEGVENAHLPSKSGAGRKGDACHVVPLCRECHEQKVYLTDPEYWASLAANMERLFPSAPAPAVEQGNLLED